MSKVKRIRVLNDLEKLQQSFVKLGKPPKKKAPSTKKKG